MRERRNSENTVSFNRRDHGSQLSEQWAVGRRQKAKPEGTAFTAYHPLPTAVASVYCFFNLASRIVRRFSFRQLAYWEI